MTTRQLGFQSGVQLNPLQDNSELPSIDNSDQLFAIVARLTRGRIDKPFKVNRSNVLQKIGVSPRMDEPEVGRLNEAYAHIIEALNNGAYEAVVQRLVTPDAVIKYAVVSAGSGAVLTPVLGTGGDAGKIVSVTIDNGGAGYVAGQKINFIDDTGTGAVATVGAVTNAELDSVAITTAGTGYSVGEEVLLSNGGAVANTAIATVATLSGTGIATVNITDGGENYKVNDVITVNSVKGVGVKANITATAGAVTAVTITKAGTGYKVGQKLKPTSTAGSGCVITIASVNANGGITGVTITTAGTSYAQSTGNALISIVGSGAKGVVTAAGFLGEITSISLVSPTGSGYSANVDAFVESNIAYSVSNNVPEGSFLFAVKHLGCFNDGIKISFRAEEKRVSGSLAENDVITLQVKDKDNNVLHSFTGSLNSDSVNEFGNSDYLPNVVVSQTDLVEIVVDDSAVSIDPASKAYGYTDGQPNWSNSGVLNCFDEGGVGYQTSDYLAATTKLKNTLFDFAYISSGGSQSTALISNLMQLAYDRNKQLRMDVSGELTPDEAITFIEGLNIGGNIDKAHLVHVYWSPLKATDPTGVNPKSVIGMATLNIAYACARNARTNAKGFAPKNYVIAGKSHPINRANITQIYTPTEQELSALARAKINPCIFNTYTGGGRYVFFDSLTSAPVENSLKKLISVIDMATSIDDAVTKFGNDALQLPMEVAVKRTKDFLKTLFEGAQTAGWLVNSTDPFMQGKAFVFEVKPNEARPWDRMDVNYWCHYDGCVRQIFVTQTLAR